MSALQPEQDDGEVGGLGVFRRLRSLKRRMAAPICRYVLFSMPQGGRGGEVEALNGIALI